MSQQMEFDEANREYTGRGYAGSHAGGSQQGDYYSGRYGQSIGQQYVGSSSPSAGQRLALAIVSLCILLPVTGIVITASVNTGSGFLGLVGGLVGLAMICLTIILVNIVFNYRR